MDNIKTSSDAADLKRRRDEANYGCSVCPCCGESTPRIFYLKDGKLHNGISSIVLCTYIKTGLFKREAKHVDYYECHTCGSEWQSDPY